MSNIKIFSQYLSFLHQCLLLPATIPDLKNAGFDGVECFLIGDCLKERRIHWVIEETKRYELGLRFHQGWKWETGDKRIWQNYVLRACRMLVPSGLSYDDQTRYVDEYPVVMYGNVAEVYTQPNYLFQTMSECIGDSYVSSIDDFVQNMTANNHPVVFDTQHVLQLHYNVMSVVDMPRNPSELSDALCMLWGRLKPLVQEIHLCDFDPEFGTSLGRNRYLGEGVLPLEEFAQEVKRGNWKGIVTPEVQPQHLRKKERLNALVEYVRKLFA